MSAARFLAAQRRVGHSLGHVDLVAEFDRSDPLGIPAREMYRKGADADSAPSARRAYRRFSAFLFEPIDAATSFHALRHSVAQGSKPLAAGFVAHEIDGAPVNVVDLPFQPGNRPRRQRTGATRGSLASNFAEDRELGKRVGAEPVCAVDADAGAFADRNTGLAGSSRFRRSPRSRPWCSGPPAAPGSAFRRGSMPRKDSASSQICGSRSRSFFAPRVAQIEIHRCAVPRGDGASLALLVPESLAQPVARTQFHRFVARPRVGRPETVILKVAIAILVGEDAAFAAASFGEQQAAARHAGRMVLHELHVAQRHAVTEGHRHAVAGDDAAIGVLLINAAGAAGCDDDRLGGHKA